jgi:hypothetical protein
VGYEWFTSFEAIPGVRWQALVPIDGSKLRGLDAKPRVERMTRYGDRAYENVTWLTPAGRLLSEESRSPAALHQGRLDPYRELTPHAVATGISEVLALPGARSDYHFGLMSAWTALHRPHERDRRAPGWIEALCLADISLMEQGPQLVFTEDHWNNDDLGGYPVFPAFDQLSNLYQHEGFLAAAAAIEKRCAALGQGRPAPEAAIARQRTLLEEDGR